MIKITAIETGKVITKSAQVTAKEGRSPFGRKVDIFRDPSFTKPMPILTFLIQHPEGNFLVDTGDTAKIRLRVIYQHGILFSQKWYQ